jgi:hypothetical protein
MRFALLSVLHYCIIIILTSGSDDSAIHSMTLSMLSDDIRQSSGYYYSTQSTMRFPSLIDPNEYIQIGVNSLMKMDLVYD